MAAKGKVTVHFCHFPENFLPPADSEIDRLVIGALDAKAHAIPPEGTTSFTGRMVHAAYTLYWILSWQPSIGRGHLVFVPTADRQKSVWAAISGHSDIAMLGELIERGVA